MNRITGREISELKPSEQRQMARWIGEGAQLPELKASAARRRLVQQARNEEENEDADVQTDGVCQDRLQAM